MPLEDIAPGGLTAPIVKMDYRQPRFSSELGAMRYQSEVGRGAALDSLVVNKGSDTLVVSLHGALNRKIYTLPRFERLATLKQTNFSSAYFSDPSLHLDPRIQLSWFTGWDGLDLHQIISLWIQRTANALGFEKIIVSGSSGGGFAALQIAAHIPRSLALVFNPQTELDKYYVSGKLSGMSAQENYVNVVYPNLLTADGQIPSEWGQQVGERASAVKRYAKPIDNKVLYCTSPTDFHHRQHFAPFMEAIQRGNNTGNVDVYEYSDGPGHHPPKTETFLTALDQAVNILEKV